MLQLAIADNSRDGKIDNAKDSEYGKSELDIDSFRDLRHVTRGNCHVRPRCCATKRPCEAI